MQKVKHMGSMITVTIFSSIAVLLNLATATCNAVGYYKIVALHKSFDYYKVLGMNYREWTMRGQQFYAIHGMICLLFVIVFGSLFVLRKVSIKNYIFGILFFYLIQVCMAAIYMFFFDPARMSVALKNLLHIPYRWQRWGFTMGFGIIGVIRILIDKNKKV